MENVGFKIPLISVIPFLLMLLSIAIFPLLMHRFWEKNKNKLTVALILSAPIIIYFTSAGLTSTIFETITFDYIPFIILLGSLYTITGGIFLDGDIEATPLINTAFLAVGAVLASIMGTTGAAMLLIRALIHTNKERKFKTHTILFFIGVVANCGGLLTPLGDSPLFMLYLRGAPFAWFFKLLPEWLVTNFLLLCVYCFVDFYYHKREPKEAIVSDKLAIRPLKIAGKLNLLWLVGVVLAVAFLNEQQLPFISNNHFYKFIREGVILSMAIFSLLFTTRLVRSSNNFSWEPIKEVAYIFLGVFVTMVPCLLYLEQNAKSLGINFANQFYYCSGLLSSFLDNAPTAVAFHSLALGLGEHTTEMVAGIPQEILKAISVGAVFFGSMTYIGNGPNFMIKAIAEENNIKLPHFFAYIYKFSLIVLLPIFIIVQLLFI